MLSRRQLVAGGLADLVFRLRGTTDADSQALRRRIAASLEGRRVVDMERLGADVLKAVAALGAAAGAGGIGGVAVVRRRHYNLRARSDALLR